MEQNRISSLIELWEEGKSDSSQEKELRDYFCTASDIPAKWLVYKTMFAGFQSLGKETAPAPKESSKKTIDLRDDFKRKTLRKRIIGISSAAAAVVIGLIAFNYYQKPYCYIDGKPVHSLKVALKATDDLGELASFDQTADEMDALEGLTDILESEKK
jgi:hypothetical protein